MDFENADPASRLRNISCFDLAGCIYFLCLYPRQFIVLLLLPSQLNEKRILNQKWSAVGPLEWYEAFIGQQTFPDPPYISILPCRSLSSGSANVPIFFQLS